MKKLIFLFIVGFTKLSYSQIYVGNGTNLKMTGSSTYIVASNISINNFGNLNQDAGTVRFSGNSDITFNSLSPVSFHNIQIARTNPGATLSLFQDINITNEVNFNQGLINLNNRNINLGSTGTLTNENENGRIFSTGDGEVIATAILSSPFMVNPGNLGAVITSSANLGSVIVQRGHRSQTNGSGQGSSILRYYDIIPANNSSLNATLRFHYFNAELNSLDENSLMMWRSENTATWFNEGYTSRDPNTNFVERTGLPGLSRFTLSSPANPLPVTGLVLSGRWNNNRSELKWVTESEFNNSHFNIERKYLSDLTFIEIGRRNSINPGGNTNELSSYYYNDPADANRGTIYYRLQQNDIDGRITYSNTLALSPGKNKLFISHIFPGSLSANTLFIQPGTMDLREIEISIFDASGRIYLKKQSAYIAQEIPLPVMTAGIYYVRITSGENVFSSAFIKK